MRPSKEQQRQAEEPHLDFKKIWDELGEKPPGPIVQLQKREIHKKRKKS